MLFEDDAVVNAIQTARRRDEIVPGISFPVQVFNKLIRFDQLVFKEAHEDHPIKRPLGDLSQRGAIKLRVLSFIAPR